MALTTSLPPAASQRSVTVGMRRAPRWVPLLADWGALLPLGLIVLLLLIGPAITIVLDCFRTKEGGLTLGNWVEVFSIPLNRRAILGSLQLGATVATVTTILGTPLAWAISHLQLGGRSVAIALLNVAANLSATALVFGFSAAFGSVGLVTLTLQSLWPGFSGVDPYDPSGAVVVYLYFHLPLFVMLILPAMSVPSARLWEASAICGASPRFFWFRVGLPLLFPFLIAGWVLMFVWAISQYGIPLALGGTNGGLNLISLRIGSLIETAGRSTRLEQAACLSVLLVVLSAVALVLYQRLLQRTARWVN